MGRPANLSPAIIQHPDVATKLFEVDLPFEQFAARSETIATAYENGELVWTKSVDLPLTDDDWTFLHAISPAPSAMLAIQKAKTRNLLRPITKDVWPKHVLRHIFGDNKQAQAERLQKLITCVNDTLRKHVRDIFNRYEFIHEDITWRLTPNDGEPIHYDYYGNDDDPHHHVRLFINIDDKPRLWGVSHGIQHAIRRYPDVARPHRDQHPNKLTESLTLKLPWAEIPRHFVAFAPGNAWLVDSRKVAHEIVYGRKLIAASFYVDPKSMLMPDKSFVNVTRAALKTI